MDLTITPQKLQGSVNIIPSKSQAHRYLICAALGKGNTTLVCPDTNQDIEATADCLQALGAKILRTGNGYTVTPISTIPNFAVLKCRESGSTLRFLLPVVGALGIDCMFQMEGRLPQRPLSPLWEEMERMGCALARPTENTLRCVGKLRPGRYAIDGSVSSQFISGLLFALPLIGESQLVITGKIESKPYIDMTKKALDLFSDQKSHDVVDVEGDWSNGAFWLAAQKLGNMIQVTGLDPASVQGDRAAAALMPALQAHITIDAADIPDLVPILSVVASANKGAVFTNIQRLRIKESDRVASTIAMLESLGGKAEASENTLTVFPATFTGGTVNAMNDHRIAMSAAIAATVSTGCVTILGAECVQKSYPSFWAEYARLGGNYEQYIR